MRRASCSGIPIFMLVDLSPIFAVSWHKICWWTKVRRGYTSHIIWKPVEIGKANQNRGLRVPKKGSTSLTLAPAYKHKLMARSWLDQPANFVPPCPFVLVLGAEESEENLF